MIVDLSQAVYRLPQSVSVAADSANEGIHLLLVRRLVGHAAVTWSQGDALSQVETGRNEWGVSREVGVAICERERMLRMAPPPAGRLGLKLALGCDCHGTATEADDCQAPSTPGSTRADNRAAGVLRMRISPGLVGSRSALYLLLRVSERECSMQPAAGNAGAAPRKSIASLAMGIKAR